MKQTNVIVNVRMVHESDDVREEHTYAEAGILKLKDGERWIVFEEKIGNEKIRTVYRVGESEVKIIRNGVIRMNHTFKSGIRTGSDYHSMYGTLFLET
ncbi:MAG: DUF1934 family protein, partial [Bacilli bacterium]